MGMLNNLSHFFGLNDEDELNVETIEEKNTIENQNSRKNSQRTVHEPYKQPTFNTRREQPKSNKVVSLNNPTGPSQSKIVVFEPRVYSEVQEIADVLLANQSVVLNFSRIDEDQAKRIVDFLTGTVYAISGDIQRIGTEIFLCTPNNIEINGALSDVVREKEFY